MKRQLTLLYIIILATAVLAATGSQYRSSPEGLLPIADEVTSSSYNSQSSLGDNATGTVSGSAYASSVGFIASTVTYVTQEPGIPVISALRFDGREIVSGDFVNSDVTITAVITSTASPIDTSASTLEIDAALITFAALTGESSYNSMTGLLTYKRSPDFLTGSHTFRITAVNALGNSVSGLITFETQSGGVQAVGGGAFCYPNPYNPDLGPAEIAYRLSADADISVYLFNSIGQKVWKMDYVFGAEGAHAGYNFIAWDGKTDFGEVAGNGIYFIRVVSKGKVIGRGKIAVIK